MPRKKPTGTPQPTWTHVILEKLRAADDFMSLEQIRAATGATRHQANNALRHLQMHKAADSVVGGDRHLWWFATGEDDRARVLEQRAKEEEPRRKAHARRRPAP